MLASTASDAITIPPDARMARNELTDKKVGQAKPMDKNYRLSDGGSLYLLVVKSGGKRWQVRYRFNGVQKTYSPGCYPEVSLKLARERRDKALNYSPKE